MYEGTVMSVGTRPIEGREFPVTISLHRRLALSPYPFALIMDELPTHIQEEASWSMLFPNDIVMVDESIDGVSAKLERWREDLELKASK